LFLSESEHRYLSSSEYLTWLESTPGSRADMRDRVRDVDRKYRERVVISTQGHVVKVRVAGRKAPQPPDCEHKRGRVFGMSHASRRRLLEKFGRMAARAVDGHRNVAVFITLTVPGEEESLPSPQEMKAHLRAFLERIRRRYPRASAVWRLEFESSGARDYHPHFHLLVFGLPWVPKETVQGWWRDVLDCEWERPFTRIEAVRSWRGVMSYASKYISAKSGGVHHDSYPHAGIDAETGEVVGDVDVETGLVHTGRLWGVFNGDHLPMAELREYVLGVGGWLYDLKRAARRVWSGVNGYSWAGFLLFVDHPEQWVELARYYRGQELEDARRCVA